VLKERGREVDAADRFDRLAINGALASLAASHRRMTRRAMQRGTEGRSGLAVVGAWGAEGTGAMGRAAQRLSDLIDSGPLTVARLTVAAGIVRDLAEVIAGEEVS